MASVGSEPKLDSWLHYFFLYDSSKVRGEGDPICAGISYFHPNQTPINDQELLCGQIAGVVCCIAEISSSPPDLMRLRKLKFATKLDGDYLWALGCAVDISDESCKQFLNQLIGLFCFYNGPARHAYEAKSQEYLREEWQLYIHHIQENAKDLNRIFNSLCNLDKTKVDNLLLLKAALILQTCQRSRHVLAGCIHYKGRIVSTQLPPPLSAKVLVQRDFEKNADRAGNVSQEQDITLPQGVKIIPVYITREEATALRDFPVEWMMRLTPSSKDRKSKHLSRTLSDIEVQHSSRDPDAENKIQDEHVEAKEMCHSHNSGDQKHPNSLSKSHKNIDTPLDNLTKNSDVPQTAIVPGATVHMETPQEFITGDERVEELNCFNEDAKDCHPVDERLHTAESLSDSDNGEINGSEHSVLGSQPISNASFITCDSSGELDKLSSNGTSDSDQGDSNLTNSTLVHLPNDSLPDEKVLLAMYGEELEVVEECSSTTKQSLQAVDGDANNRLENTDGSDQKKERFFSFVDDATGHSESTTERNLMVKTGGLDSVSDNHADVVKMRLYTHSFKGLALSLLTEDAFQEDDDSKQDVFNSSLASLNGLEVHLKETSPKEQPSANKATYTFTHYDCIQNVVTANLQQSPSDPVQHFLRAVGLMHSDFLHHPTIHEVTIRNAATAIYGCQSPVHETFFQQIASHHNSGAPNPHDSAFSLPGKSKQKLLKHGVNLL
ncbi:BLOC-3 complex member HPS4 [Ambystoma mexicanum]|uniref:BLOC-3 complex member HPS4 n=1 Tax=Ambystoma mexicanum TaxID=8296 RepID=UPI0037E7252E